MSELAQTATSESSPGATKAYSVRLENVSFAYHDVSGADAQLASEPASTESSVRNITLHVAPGTCTVLCGGSGHGKSTVLRVIDGLAGTFFPGNTDGIIEIAGKPAASLSAAERTRLVGVVMQDPRSQFFMDVVADEIAFSAESLGIDPTEVTKRVERVAALCGVGNLLHSKVSQLSSGQKQRVAIAAAIVCEPRVLVLDEPTSNLDASGTADLIRILTNLKSRGVAIVISEHRLHAMTPIADEFVYLHQGAITRRWTAREFSTLGLEECMQLGLRHPDMQLTAGSDKPETLQPADSNPAAGTREGAVPTERPTFELCDITYRYPSTRRGISNVDLQIPAGQVTVLHGGNGTGKTTLARILCGSAREQEGSMLKNGDPLALKERRRVSYFVMQDADYQLYAGSVADEVVLGRKVDDALRERAWEAIDAFDLHEQADRHPASLSGGQKQRVTLAAAYCSDAELIVLDEPTSGLDGKGVRNVATWCRRLAQAGKAVLVITHDELVTRLAADHVFDLGKGTDDMAHSQSTSEQPNAFGKLYHFMRADRGKMVFSVLLACIGEVAGMVPYVAIAWLAAGLLESTLTLEGAAIAAGASALAHTIRFFCTWKSSMTSHRIAFKALQSMRDAMAEKMQRVPMGTIVDTPTGTFKNRFIDNVNQLEDAIAHFMPELPSNMFGPMLAMVVVFAIDWRMGLAGLATLPLGVLFYAAMMRDYKAKMERYITSEQKMNASLVEYVNGIQVIKAYQRTASSYGTFSDAVADYHDSTLAWYKQSWIWMAAIRSVMPCTLLAGVPLGVLFMGDGSLTLPAFLTCITIPLGFIGPVMKFSMAASQISRMDICLTVIWDFLNEPELTRPSERVELQGQSFEFDHVSFAYHEGTEVLHDVNFATQPGTVTAIVGPSGSGKSTIAKLMAGFWDATDGFVRFGGRDVRDIPFEQLMESISYVSQDTFLFDDTLAGNIRLGRPEATDEQVREAARAAGCDEFIRALPQGYETPAGEAGTRLSGGEKQRIAIARAVLKNAPIVILDEATAYADPENEAYVQRALSELVRDKTLVTIAHRLSTVKDADCILVVDAGRIVAQGTHAELLENCPLYARMWAEHVAATTGRMGDINAEQEAM